MMISNIARASGMAMRRVGVCARQAACRNLTRQFSSPAVQKLQKGLQSELQFEKENYQAMEEKLPKDWTLTDIAGDVNMKIERKLACGKSVKVEWQLVSPYQPEADMFEGADKDGSENKEDANLESEVDFTISVETGEKGITYFCNTQQGDGHRFIVGNVKTWSTAAERDSPSAYNGPDFEDLEDSLQESMDEYLAEIGVTEEVYDFIDASALDKEHREYMRWLDNLNGFMKA